jgi:hypothetical protein
MTKSGRATLAIASSGLMLLLASGSARAQTVPVAPKVAGTLDKTTGLGASSASPVGLQDPTAATVQRYVRAVSAIHVAMSFVADPGPKMHLGALDVSGGATFKLDGTYSKKAGQTSATLDGLTFDATGVSSDSLVGVRHAEIHADGSMRILLNFPIPALHIKRVQSNPDGSTTLVSGDWYAPSVTITKAGDVQMLGLSLGHVDPDLFTQWPPTLEDLAHAAQSILATPSKAAQPGLTGTANWQVDGKTDPVGLPPPVDPRVQASGSFNFVGMGKLTGTSFATIGDANTATVDLKVGGALGSAFAGVSAFGVGAHLDGHYGFTIPLKATTGAASNVSVEMNGTATYAAVGNKVYLSLPSGARVTTDQVTASGSSTFQAHVDGSGAGIEVQGGHLGTEVRGPIQVTKLGPIGSLTVGTPSTIVSTVGLAGALQGQTGPTVIAPGTPALVSLGFDSVTGSVELPAKGAPTVNLSGTVQGNLDAGVTAAAGNTSVSSPSVTGSLNGTVAASLTNGTADVRGHVLGALGATDATVKAPGTSIALKGQAAGSVDLPFDATTGPDGKTAVAVTSNQLSVPLRVDLKAGTQVTLTQNGVRTNVTLDQDGSFVQLTGKIALGPDGKPTVSELDDVNVLLSLGPTAATVLGHNVQAGGQKTATLKGRVVLRPNGMDVYGDFEVSVKGDATTPIMSLTW